MPHFMNWLYSKWSSKWIASKYAAGIILQRGHVPCSGRPKAYKQRHDSRAALTFSLPRSSSNSVMLLHPLLKAKEYK